ncbi:hypothetical protein CLAFUW4_02141 [Fulvia fulva]|uniref:Uncharacterized protein n=1 Tax=Passalora fulva TaxID=5499 RepID=A0A9Q8P2P4_PASFU|nr:uncharacterized protein CLAFUR5_02132 [Fulvia fulva]KAK4634913.1 hypothetical protein CLAFUR4_02137 [Fulvia fulva]KAK4638122.1 hypothetical protein CLAFUR0_02140 [Fulvia fulva]UJO10964.1 hypothetical protein CLAFUR5_02132 [Fulvia fulva]WPV10108.1 hypothetical protein CLAFUW4_02141 [Fulvia fulva]WPV24806.1 hypothetical protein CLAFUW7_02141 [Fulvia fulva]
MSSSNLDSRMSSPSRSSSTSSPDTTTTTTPQTHLTNTAILSPPDSQHRTMPAPTTASTSASSTSIANSNGKRPIQTISNGNDDMDELAAMANGKARQDMPVRTHQASGFQWQRAEDEPGYGWLNKKAVDEFSRVAETLQHKDSMIKNRYGDPFEAVEKEKAVLASMK